MYYIPTIVILVLSIFYQRSNRWYIGPISLLYLTYLVMCFFSILGKAIGIIRPVLPISFSAMLFLSSGFFIVFLGFSSFRDEYFKSIIVENERLYNLLTFGLIVMGFLAIIFFIPLAMNALDGDIRANRINQINLETMSSFGIINSFASLFANMMPLMILCSLIDFSLPSIKNSIRGSLLLISSFSYVVYITAYVGRDALIYWEMSFLFSYLLLRRFIYRKNQVLVITLFIVISILASIPFIMISTARFGSGIETKLRNDIEIIDESGNRSKHSFIIESLVDYAGQQISNFNDKFIINPPKRFGGENFPVIAKFIERIGIPIKPIYNNELLYNYYFQFGAVPWVFYTFIGSFLSDFGRLGALVCLLIINISTRISIRSMHKSESLSFSSLIIFCLLYQIVHWGVFFFRQYATNFYMIGMILIAITFWLTGKCCKKSDMRKENSKFFEVVRK